MRYVLYGAGAVGGLVGAGLFASGHDVTLIARGAQYQAIKDRGLQVNTPAGAERYHVPVIDHPRSITFGNDVVVMLGMKSQDTLDALGELGKVAPVSTNIVCVQNGVENERVALRLFQNVYGVCVVAGTSFLEPGVVVAEAGPIFGSLDIGRYPNGIDDVTLTIKQDLSSYWRVFPRERVMEWKYTKLLRNLVLAVQVLCGPQVRQGKFFDIARAEGEACLRAAQITFIGDDEWSEARSQGPSVVLPPEGRKVGGSSWQSLARGTGSIESAFLNGEILMLSREFGIPAPANALLYELGMQMTTSGAPPGQMNEDELLALLGS
jgi:2-dehydropantoate 2-reductase